MKPFLNIPACILALITTAASAQKINAGLNDALSMLFIYAAICVVGMCLPAIYILASRGPDKSPWLLALLAVHSVTALIILPAAVYLHMIMTYVPWLLVTLPGYMVAIIYHDAGVKRNR